MKKFTILFASMCACLALHAQNTGIGTASPLMPLHVSTTDTAVMLVENRANLAEGTSNHFFFKNGTYFTGGIRVVGTGVNTARLSLLTYSSNDRKNLLERLTITDNGLIGINTTAPTAGLDVNGTFRLRSGSPAAGNVLTADANGNASWQVPAVQKIGFSATLTNTQSLTTGTAYDLAGFTESFDDGNVFTPATGRFTAPADGVYQFTYNLNFTETGTDTKYVSITVKNSGSTRLSFSHVSPGINSNWSSSYTNTFIMKLEKDDYITLAVSRDAVSGNQLRGGANFANSTFFQGHKLY